MLIARSAFLFSSAFTSDASAISKSNIRERVEAINGTKRLFDVGLVVAIRTVNSSVNK